jgi:hypothetical protein
MMQSCRLVSARPGQICTGAGLLTILADQPQAKGPPFMQIFASQVDENLSLYFSAYSRNPLLQTQQSLAMDSLCDQLDNGTSDLKIVLF